MQNYLLKFQIQLTFAPFIMSVVVEACTATNFAFNILLKEYILKFQSKMVSESELPLYSGHIK